MSFIPYGRQNISENDIQAVIDVLNSDFLTQGPVIGKFEDAIKDYCRVKHAVAVNSATSALHLACLALELEPGDIAWTSPITFVATSNAVLFCGGTVDFVDIDPETGNMSVTELAKKLEKAKIEGKLPRIVIPVHLGGQSCDMKEIYQLSKVYGFKIIEDAAHAIGGKYLGQPVGNCAYSDITVFSFHPVKIITTGEGGMATTQDNYLAEKMRLLSSHGVTRDLSKMENTPDGPWYYEQIALGYNYRMTEMQAALGISQLKRLDEFVSVRNTLAAKYFEALNGLPLELLKVKPDSVSSYHLLIAKLHLEKISSSQKQVFESLRGMGIGANLNYIPVYKHPYYQRLGFNYQYLPNAENYYQRAISIPLFPDIDLVMFEKVISSVRSALG